MCYEKNSQLLDSTILHKSLKITQSSKTKSSSYYRLQYYDAKILFLQSLKFKNEEPNDM